MLSEIIKPENVHSPRQNWTLIRVLDDGQRDRGALALGLWNGKPVLAMRWNGTEAKPKGNPISTGCPTWFIVPDKFAEAVLRSGQISSQDVRYAMNFMGLKLIEMFRGASIEASPTHNYQITWIERIYSLEGRDYIVRVEPLEASRGAMKVPDHSHSSRTLPFTCRFHFARDYEPDESLGNAIEERDGILIVGKLTSCLHNDPEGLFSKNAEGQYQINFP